VADPWPVLLGDLLDPTPGRAVLRDRAAWLVGIYAFGVAADVVERGCRRKTDADAVTRGMTGSVVACTLWVVALELLTAVWVFRR
jgi:ABC-type transporter Mla maintaining outer membrane lipid asymmetry permease subunit MlaE